MQRLDAAGIDNTKMAAHGTAAARHASSGRVKASPHNTSNTTTTATNSVYNSWYEGVFAVSSVWLQFDVLFL